jgi:RimJ/RimL family protein N-acetyltransferase
MSPAEFSAWHAPALERDEVRHGLILGILAGAAGQHAANITCWTLGGPGECAIKAEGRSIVLGALRESECRTLAELTAHTDYPGVIGPDASAEWFASRARELGLEFQEPERQQIYAIGEPPRYPAASGHPRLVTRDDATLLSEWLTAFRREAVPNDPVPPPGEGERAAGEGRFMFWIDNGQPVSMAGIVRRLKTSAAITGVYTPPSMRGRGYAGSVTAATVERVYAEGRKIACLYADLNNPISNRCYVRIGFRPVCGSLHIRRRGPDLIAESSGRPGTA